MARTITPATVTEDTVTGVAVVGHSVDGEQDGCARPRGHDRAFLFGLSPAMTSATVEFLNDPGDDPTPTSTPPGGTPPAGDTPTPTSTPEPEPTQPVVEETPTEEPSPEPTDSAIEGTPIAPDSGQGLASDGSSARMSLLFVMLGLMAFGGACGALSLARTKRR